MKIKRILVDPSLYEKMNLEGQKEVERQLALLSGEQLVKILNSVPLETGDAFYLCVARVYARGFVQNVHQERIIVDSLMNERILKRTKKKKKKKGMVRVIERDRLNFC